MFAKTDAEVRPTVPDLLQISLTDLAKRKNCTPRNIQKKVAKLESEGLITVKKKGRAKFVNLAEYDRVVGEIEDPAKQLGNETARANKDVDSGHNYRSAKAEREGYLAELARLDLEERMEKLRPVNEIADALVAIGREVLQSADAMATGRAEELFGAAKKGDLAAFRQKYQKIVRQWAEQTATRLADAAFDQDNSK